MDVAVDPMGLLNSGQDDQRKPRTNIFRSDRNDGKAAIAGWEKNEGSGGNRPPGWSKQLPGEAVQRSAKAERKRARLAEASSTIMAAAAMAYESEDAQPKKRRKKQAVGSMVAQVRDGRAVGRAARVALW